MSKLAVVYWSGTGNTEVIAKLVAQGAESAGADVSLYQPWDFDDEAFAQFDRIAFGSPAMGDEQLETEDFQPLWDHLKPQLTNRKIALFGSYNWNNGEWMDLWMQECSQSGLNVIGEGLAILDAPEKGSDEEAQAIALGKALAQA